MFCRPNKTRTARFLNGFKNIPQKACLGSPNKGSNCQGKILAYNKNKLCLISILYIQNTNKKCFIMIKSSCDTLLVF